MRPMQNPAFFVPFVLAIKLNRITFTQTANSGGEINIMCDQ